MGCDAMIPTCRSARQHSCRSLVRSLVLLPVLMLATMVASRPTHTQAYEEWCWDDPVISINGQHTRILVGLQGSAAVTVSGVTANIVVTLPAGVTTSIIVPP